MLLEKRYRERVFEDLTLRGPYTGDNNAYKLKQRDKYYYWYPYDDENQRNGQYSIEKY